MTWLLAHQGGWDEILLFVGPIILAFIVIRSLERRGKKRQEEAQDSQNTVP